MAQGQFSASCQGLWSVMEGKRTYSLKQLSKSERCQLPKFFAKHSHWVSLNHSLSLQLDAGGTSFSLMVSGTTLQQVYCHSSTVERNIATVIAHVKSGCSSDYICLQITGLDVNIIEMSFGLKSNHPSESCQHFYFSGVSKQQIVLVAEERSA